MRTSLYTRFEGYQSKWKRVVYLAIIFKRSLTKRHWSCDSHRLPSHYCDVIMGSIASQFTSLTIVYSSFYSGADEREHQSSASLAFVRGPVNSSHKGPVTRKIFPFDDVIMYCETPEDILHTTPLKVKRCECLKKMNAIVYQKVDIV